MICMNFARVYKYWNGNKPKWKKEKPKLCERSHVCVCALRLKEVWSVGEEGDGK